jgi:hypothetical protein
VGEPKPKAEEFEFLAMDVPSTEKKAPEDIKKAEPKTATTVFKEGRVQEYRKASKIVVINIGSSTSGIKVGVSGKLYNDAAKTRQIGVVDLTNVRSTFSEGVVRNILFEINLKEMEVIAVFEVQE